MPKRFRFQDLIQELYALETSKGMKFGLENSQRLDEALSFPSRSFPSIHVAGTNGKGSVCTKIAYAFQNSGKKVGLYTSPHISCFRERIQINGEMISEESIEEHLPLLFSLCAEKNIPATFFELTTLLAFFYFKMQKVDLAILEVGLGGRLDATNIVTPILSIITSISFDHKEILGNTLEDIAREKGGIIKPSIPVVVGPRVPFETILKIAQENQSPLVQVPGTFSTYDEENSKIAETALEHFKMGREIIRRALHQRPPCRFECINIQECQIILDVAHNPDGISALVNTFKDQFPDQKARIVCGFSSNKDLGSCLSILANTATGFHLVKAECERGTPSKDLAQHLYSLNVSKQKVHLHDSIDEGVHMGFQQACQRNEILIICGTFFIMDAAKRSLFSLLGNAKIGFT